MENIKYTTDLSGEEIYIITGKRTGSASVVLTNILQSKMGATVVGEETGGNVNLFAGGAKPDIEVKQSYEDYINGIDTCYEYIKNIN